MAYTPLQKNSRYNKVCVVQFLLISCCLQMNNPL